MPRLSRWVLAGVAAMSVAVSARAGEPEPADLSRQAHAILKANCHRCHGLDGAVEGGFNYVLEFDQLVGRRKVVPRNPDQSKILLRMMKGQMPPAGEEPRPSAADVEIVRKWIAAGAPRFGREAAPRQVVSTAETLRWVLADLETIDRRSRRFQRYFTLVPQANSGLGPDELQTYRHALAKLLNSLSWHSQLLRPTPVGPDGLLLRFDLREVMWDNTLWNRLLLDYPYGVLEDSAAARAVVVATASRLPVVRGDWFLATASRPPLYYDLLQLPTNLSELERQLRVDAVLNVQQERVMRAGFNGSGVSRNNRLIERHDALHGAYWRTYDFDAVPQNLGDRGGLAPDRRNLFAYPLGPGASDNTFQHAGGEVIFHLPNGLLGFCLTNAINVRIDKAPTAIVSDPRRPDRAVEPGISCLSCHIPGIIPKADQIREHQLRNPGAFSRADAELIRALYAPEAKMRERMEADGARFRQSVAALGGKPGRTEPVSTLALRYEADLDAPTAAAELGLAPDVFKAALDHTDDITRNLGALRVAGGTVSRQVFVQAFGDLVKPLNLGALLTATTPASLPDNTGDLDPLDGPGGTANQIAFAPAGRRALVASADRTLKLLDLETGREVRRLIGHTASVWSVALSADGRRALSGGLDGTMRLWDVQSGSELRRFDGHLSLVASVAFSPDGRRALSAGFDRAFIVWDLSTGREIRRFETKSSYLHLIAFTPDGSRAMVGSDGGLSLWDLDAGAAVRRFDAGSLPVTAVAFSADGNRFLTAGDDGLVRLFTLDNDKELRQYSGHVGPVRGVAWSPDGRWFVSAGSDRTVRLCQAESGQELGVFRKHGDSVIQITFTPDGRQTLSSDRESRFLFWDLSKFGPRSPTANETVGVAMGTEVAPAVSLKPLATLPTSATVGGLTLSPNGKWLYWLDRATGTLVRLDAATLGQIQSARLAQGVETISLSPNGKWLFALAPTGSNGKSQVQVVDPLALEVRRTLTLESTAYDLVAADNGEFYTTGASGAWTEISAVDGETGRVAAHWGGVWSRSFLQLSADQTRLYVGTQGVKPGQVQALPLPVQPGETPTLYAAPTSSDNPLGGPFVLSPDGRFLLCQTGSVLQLDKSHEADLQPFARVEPFLAASIDADRGVAMVATASGWLKRYSYPGFRPLDSLKLPGLAYQSAFDQKSGRLYLAVIDPEAIRDRPRAHGFGDIHVYDLKSLTAKK